MKQNNTRNKTKTNNETVMNLKYILQAHQIKFGPGSKHALYSQKMTQKPSLGQYPCKRH